MKKIKGCAALIAAAALFFAAGCAKKRETVRAFALDTEISITTDAADKKTAEEAVSICRKYEKMFSRIDSESELSRLNSGEIKAPGSELKSLIETGLSFSRLTDGAFDITLAPLTDLWNIKERKIPPESSEIAAALRNTGYERVTLEPFSLGGTKIDLGAVAKGYIADRLREYFNKQGVNNVICDLGGNVMLSGEYTVGIQSPFSEGELFAVMRLSDTNAVTSGAYQRYFEYNGVRYHHILDARTGSCAESDAASVTVVSPCAVNADALSTAIFILGTDGLELCSRFPDTGAILITKDGEYHTTEGFAEKYKLEIK